MSSKKRGRKKTASYKKSIKTPSNLKQAKKQEISAADRSLRSRLQGQIKRAATDYQARKLRSQLKTFDLFVEQIQKAEARETQKPKSRVKPAPSKAKPGRSPKKALQRPQRADYDLARELKAKYPDLSPRALKSKTKSITDEIRALRNPIYKLRKEIEKAPNRYQRKKLKERLQTYELLVQRHISELNEEKAEITILLQQSESLKHEKQRLQKRNESIDKKIQKAYEEVDWQTIEKQTFQRIKNEGIIDQIDILLGKKQPSPEISYTPQTEEDELGYLDDPANPYTIWDASRKLQEDLSSGEWDYIIVNGKRFSTQNIVEVRLEAASFWQTLKRKQSSTPRVLRSFSEKKKTVRYKMYKE